MRTANNKEAGEQKKANKAADPRKPKIDTGLKRPKEDDNNGRVGSTFDPKTAKGNVMLFRYINDISL